MYVDSHCHLTHSKFAREAEVVIKRALAANVKRMYVTGGMLGHDADVLKLCNKYRDYLRPVIGISPHDANRVTLEQKEALFDLIERNRKRLAGIGEIGLDFHYFKTSGEQATQEKLFREEIELARTLDLPIIIHSRKAEAKCLSILEEVKFFDFAMHCFVVKQLAQMVVQLGGMISLPTIKSKERRYIMKQMPLENFLCETDSPYLWQNGRNEPANVTEVYESIAKNREISIEKVEAQVFQNVERFYR